MEIEIFPTKTELGRADAGYASDFIKDALRKRGCATVMLATGASQFEFFDCLVRADIDWCLVTVFHLDEYIGLPRTHPASFCRYLKECFEKRVGELGAFHYINREAVDTDAECRRLNSLLGERAIDVAFVGIGENGHLAFNDPPADYDTLAPHIVFQLDQACRRQQLGEGWSPSFEAVPERAISMSLPQIMQSRNIVCCVPDRRKAQAVKGVVEADISPDISSPIPFTMPTPARRRVGISLEANREMTSGDLSIPGFVDLQVNGFLGTDFSDLDLNENAFAEACRTLLQRITAAFIPTLITTSPETYARNLPLIARVVKSDEFAQKLLGIHLEGPFISHHPGAIGAHDRKFVRLLDIDFFLQLNDWARGCVRLITVAAKAEGADTLMRVAAEQGIAISAGHSLATPQDLRRLADAGARVVTHLGHGLPNLQDHHHNFIWSSLADDNYATMLIADGHHLPEPILKSLICAKGSGRIVIVSDAAPIADMPPGNYQTLGSDVILEPEGLIFNPVKQCLVGSSACLLECMNYLASMELLTPDELIAAGFSRPRELTGMDASEIRAHAVPENRVVYDQGTFSIMESN